MRQLFLVSLAALAACSQPAESGDPAPAPEGESIACALGGSESFDSRCILERKDNDVVLHHPDGSFRRFLFYPDGGGLVAADGADSSSQKIDGDWLLLSVGGDRYRVPFIAKRRDDG
ncbi:hypothetical protein [Pseudoblastomonas halimionae]|uniref:Lipoprotein n=1 Tax=Alteriqipengyuania halimionae TaxID=1926630 RepID=A0A6I4U079_9SPHN|nr:hypothetical protein [Alteriqipengyuania halimionae]MXP09278.1 hypothetical protein [Alteriqipengyuania halimionae]